MLDLSTSLQELKKSLCREIDVGGLFTRNPIAHKWKAPWRSILLRESVAWRVQDLLEQSLALSRIGSLLGARILLRSAFETLAVLIFLNMSIRSVLAGDLKFHDFSEKTSRLLLGSRDETTNHEQVNILTILDRANKRYPKLSDWYAALSESAHPNYEGMLVGYSTADRESQVTIFKNRWKDLYEQTHEDALYACLVVFLAEYNEESTNAFEQLERWIEINNTELESNLESS